MPELSSPVGEFFFDNLVVCIRQPRRNERERREDSSRREPLREAGVRAVTPKRPA
jgi:hypothetical protein